MLSLDPNAQGQTTTWWSANVQDVGEIHGVVERVVLKVCSRKGVVGQRNSGGEKYVASKV
jgi:hypothetical protein